MGGGTLIRCTEKECRYDISDSACRRSPLTLFHTWNLPHFTMAGKSAPLKTMAGQRFVTWLQRYSFMLKVELFQFDFLFLCSFIPLFSISRIIWAHIFTVLRSLFATPTYPPETANRGEWSVSAVQVSDSVRYSPFRETHLPYICSLVSSARISRLPWRWGQRL